jgi:hypothetical protein
MGGPRRAGRASLLKGRAIARIDEILGSTPLVIQAIVFLIGLIVGLWFMVLLFALVIIATSVHP